MLDIPSYILGKKSGGGEGTTNYNQLSNKPSINDVTLSGNKTTADLGITIPTKTSDLTNDGTNATGIDMANFALSNEADSGLYIGSGNDIRVRKGLTSSTYTDTSIEVQANKVTSISSSSTDTEYPSAKAVNTLFNSSKSIVIGERTSNTTLTITTAWSAGQVKVPLQNLYLNQGNDYSLTNDGTIKVGARPKLVKITSQISPYGWYVSTSSFSVGIKRKRNGVVETLGSTEQIATASQLTFIYSLIAEVQENDEIYTAIGTSEPTQSASTGVGKFVTIETLSY